MAGPRVAVTVRASPRWASCTGRGDAAAHVRSGLTSHPAPPRSEARLLAEFDHPHVLPVFHAGEDEGLPYITMRLAEGGSLRGLIGRRLLPGHALRLLSQVADALDALHRRNVVHLDVKPENILLEGPAGDERVWLADLGLARSVPPLSPPSLHPHSATPIVPPDVYSFALVLYEPSRRPLLERGTPMRLACAPSLRVVFERALAHDPGERHPSAGAVLDHARAALTAGTGEEVPVDGGSIAGHALLSGTPSVTSVAPTAEASPRRLWPAVIAAPVLACAVAGTVWAVWPSALRRPLTRRSPPRLAPRRRSALCGSARST